MSKHPKKGRDLLAGQGPDFDGFAERQIEAARCADLQARCERLEASLEETVRVLAFAFEEGALPDETVYGLCIDPHGILNDARAALKD